MSIDWPLILQGSKIILDAVAEASWPIAFLTGLIIFREPIRNVLSRIRRLNTFGNEAEFLPAEAGSQQKPEQPDEAALVPAGQVASELPPPNPVYDFFDGQARDLLDKHVPGSCERKLAWAIRMRSISEANRIHETNYRFIFGSQLVALKALNVTGQMSLTELQSFFNTVASGSDWEAVHKNRTFEQWMQFLIGAGYVERVPNADPPAVQITSFGQQFLIWLTEARAPEIKPG